MPYRFVLLISFLFLPILSFGQGFYTHPNALPVVGLENVYLAQHQKIEPKLFVSSNAIIAKSAGTVFFVDGLIQTDTLSMATSNLVEFLTTTPKETNYKINNDKNPIAEAVTTEVQQDTYKAALPILPWQHNPLQNKINYGAVSVVSVPTTPQLIKDKKKQFQMHQSGANLLQIVYIKRCYTTYFTSSSAAAFGKNATDFSCRPPPVS